MDTSTWNVLSVCSGVGGLDLGVKLAVPIARTICYVEREAFAVSVLVARMQDKCLDDAPVWTDIKTFDGKPWHGKVDCIIGGYPCQPFSIAGSMQGENDPRHLWPDIRRIIGEVQPSWCFFENVENHVKIGFENVRQDLLACGFGIEAGIFTAEEVGAPHGRARLFILAKSESVECKRIESKRETREQSKRSIGNSSGVVADSEQSQFQISSASQSDRTERATASSTGRKLGNSISKRLEGWSSNGSECSYQCPAWPPSPEDRDRWREVLEQDKTVEPAIYRVVDGMDTRLDSSIYAYRQERLRAVGNGVVPLTAAFAFWTLMRKFL